MREIHDKTLLDAYLRKYHIEALFDTPDLPFRLYEYEPGELVNILHPTGEYLKFTVDGCFRDYLVCPDGHYAFVSDHPNSFYVLGDLDFCGCCADRIYQEVVETLRTVELPLLTLREKLLNDNRFLRHLIRRMGQKMAACSQFVDRPSLEESLLYYLRQECPDHRITRVEDTAFRLSYSRSQLQRVLRDLTTRGVLEKEGKGIYRLIEP